jgi:hypothetical protein
MAVAPGSAVSYTSYDDDVLTLFPWTGRHVALLTASNALDGNIIERILAGLDAAYETYALITGRSPAPFKLYSGLATIAQVPTAYHGGAAAIGFIGATGIEITPEPFDALYSGVASSGVFDQALFYELGRNFWFYGDQLGKDSPFVTGFAIVNRFISMEQAGLIGGPFGSIPFVEFRTSILEDLAQTFFSGTTYTLGNTLGANSGVPNNHNWGAADLAAALLYQVYEDFGFAAYSRFYRVLGTLPIANKQLAATTPS